MGNCSNYSPISLINADCKIVTKILALQLQSVLPNNVHANQARLSKESIKATEAAPFTVSAYAADDM